MLAFIRSSVSKAHAFEAGDDPIGPSRAARRSDGCRRGARPRVIGRLARPLLVLAACGLAFIDWEPTLSRCAPTEWLASRAGNDDAPFSNAAAAELMRRLAGGDHDDASLGRMVRALWRISVRPTRALSLGQPFDVNVSLAPPPPPISMEQLLPTGRVFGRIEWRVVAATLNDVPLDPVAGAVPQCVAVKSSSIETWQTLRVPDEVAHLGRGTLRCDVRFAFRSPDGARVGPEWTVRAAENVVVSEEP